VRRPRETTEAIKMAEQAQRDGSAKAPAGTQELGAVR
jgi:hypothetical protein